MGDRGKPIRLDLPPGFLIGESQLAGRGRYTAGFGVRFLRGRMEKRGGYAALSTTPIIGFARGAHTWYASGDSQYIGVGTQAKAYGISQRDFAPIDITPILATTDATDPFSTTNASATVTVTWTAHGGATGQYFDFSGADPVAGLTIDGSYALVNVVDADNFTINAGTAANATTTGGGTVHIEKELDPGLADPAEGFGWGAGRWGNEEWDTPRSGGSINFAPRLWSVDNFGDIGLFGPSDGTIYEWNPLTLPNVRATAVAGAPLTCTGFFVTSDGMVIAYGTDYDSGSPGPGGPRNLMQVWNSAQGSYTVWDTTAEAGPLGAPSRVRQLQQGNMVMGGCDLGSHVALLWTDQAAYALQYTGSTFVFDNQYVGDNCGLIGRWAWVNVGSKAFWMSPNGFWQYDGGVSAMPNWQDIGEFVFGRLRTSFTAKAIAWYDQRYREVCFAFVDTESSENSLCLVFSEDSQRWHTDTLIAARCASTRFSGDQAKPIFFSTDGLIYEDNIGLDAAGAAKPWSITFAPVEIAVGEVSQDIDGFVRDVERQVGEVTVAISMYDRAQPNEAAIDSELLTFAAGGPALDDARLEGRYASITISGVGVGCDVRLGIPTLMVSQSGRRR